MKTKLFLLSFLLFTGLIYGQNLPNNLYGQFEFTNGSLINGVSATGEDLSGPISKVTDRFGYEFNAIGATGVLSGHSIGANNYNDFTLSFWIKTNTIAIPARIIQIYGLGGNGFRLEIVNNTLILNAKATNNVGLVRGVVNDEPIANLSDNEWHNIVVRTKESANPDTVTIDVFVDNILKTNISGSFVFGSSSSGTIDSFLNSASLTINPLSGNSGSYPGQIDDVYVYRESLTDSQITEIYNYVPDSADLSRYYVNNAATGNNSGDSWTNAYTNLQDALSNASAPYEIWVAKGTYKPDASDVNKSFVLLGSLYGGFSGNEANLADRDLSLIHTTNATILSGDLAGDDDNTLDFNDDTRDDNSKHVVEVSNNNIEINGVTVQDGYADATSGDNRFGAGIFKTIGIADLIVRHCIVKNNVAFSGAGLALSTTSSNSNMTIDACIIENNLANVAAGIDYHRSGSSGSMSIDITNTLFKSNKTNNDTSKSRTGFGAAAVRLRAFFTNVTLNAKVVNNTFVNNVSLGTGSSSDFPVVDISRNDGDWGNITVANNIFWGNTNNENVSSKAIGRSGSSTRFGNTSSTRIVKNNIDEDGLSLIAGTSLTSSVNPNLNTDFKLTPGSGAIDSGDNSLLPANINFDLLGNSRIYNSIVDRGAFEFDPSKVLSTENISLLNETSVYPNPVTNNLHIKSKENILKIVVYNLLGKQLIEKENSSFINLSNLKPNIYFVRIFTAKSNISKRILKN